MKKFQTMPETIDLVTDLVDAVHHRFFNGQVTLQKAGEAVQAIDHMYGTNWAEYYFYKRYEECTCGNVEYGFNCTCEWSYRNPGEKEFTCLFCGIYQASSPQCNQCEEG